MNNELLKELQREILRQIKLFNPHEKELKYIMDDFDSALQKVSKLSKDLQNEVARLFLILLKKYGLINIK